MPVIFTNAALLFGLLALGIPILIHLLLKRKQQRLRFSTIQFFQRLDEKASQKRKLRNLLLLAMRLLLFALLVFAFARPILPDRLVPGTDGPPRQAVIVLDGSASMQATDRDGSRWARAKDAASRIVASLRPDDRAALVSCATKATVVSGFGPPPIFQEKLAALSPTSGSGNI